MRIQRARVHRPESNTKLTSYEAELTYDFTGFCINFALLFQGTGHPCLHKFVSKLSGVQAHAELAYWPIPQIHMT